MNAIKVAFLRKMVREEREREREKVTRLYHHISIQSAVRVMNQVLVSITQQYVIIT